MMLAPLEQVPLALRNVLIACAQKLRERTKKDLDGDHT